MTTFMSLTKHVSRNISRRTVPPKCYFGMSTISYADEKKRTTVDEQEVKIHSGIMNHWWDLKGPVAPLHTYNLLRVPFVRDGLVQQHPEQRTCTPLVGKKILDIGCGGGILSEPLAKLGAEVTGVDASKELIEVATLHSKMNPSLLNNRPTYYATTIEDHAETFIDYYDGVVASEIIEHVNNDQKELFVKSCLRTLKPGGKIFFTTPTRTRISQLTNIIFAEYILKMIPKGMHQYEKFITPNELTFMLERNGCHVEAVYGVFYHPLQNRWQWVSSTSLLFALQAIKLNDNKN